MALRPPDAVRPARHILAAGYLSLVATQLQGHRKDGESKHGDAPTSTRTGREAMERKGSDAGEALRPHGAVAVAAHVLRLGYYALPEQPPQRPDAPASRRAPFEAAPAPAPAPTSLDDSKRPPELVAHPQQLLVTILQGTGLVGWGTAARDPMVCLSLGEDRLQTSCRPGEAAPTWDESGSLAIADLNQQLEIVVRHRDEEGPMLGFYALPLRRCVRVGPVDLRVPLLCYNPSTDAMECPEADSKLHLRCEARGVAEDQVRALEAEGRWSMAMRRSLDAAAAEAGPGPASAAGTDRVDLRPAGGGAIPAIAYPGADATEAVNRYKRQRPHREPSVVEEAIRSQQGAKLTSAEELQKRRRHAENVRWAKEQREGAAKAEKSAFARTLEKQYSELEEMNKSWRSYRDEVAPLVGRPKKPRKPTALGDFSRLQAFVRPLHDGQQQGYQGWD